MGGGHERPVARASGNPATSAKAHPTAVQTPWGLSLLGLGPPMATGSPMRSPARGPSAQGHAPFPCIIFRSSCPSASPCLGHWTDGASEQDDPHSQGEELPPQHWDTGSSISLRGWHSPYPAPRPHHGAMWRTQGQALSWGPLELWVLCPVSRQKGLELLSHSGHSDRQASPPGVPYLIFGGRCSDAQKVCAVAKASKSSGPAGTVW